MSKPRTKLARAALISNGMVWFGLSLMLFSIAGEQTATLDAPSGCPAERSLYGTSSGTAQH